MPAYSVSIARRCYEPGCQKQATEEVRDGRNEAIGAFCQRHAEALVKRLNKRSF